MPDLGIAPRLVNYTNTRIALDRACAVARRPIGAAAVILLLLGTWGLLHHYRGLALDGELYTFQAVARLHPWLRSDIYLMGNSQDGLTFFSPLYAFFIRWLGLWNASVVLFALCTATFFSGAWSAARSLWNEHDAWLALLACVVLVCGYGAYNVFSYSETYLTARSMAEAMVVVSLACQLRGFHWMSRIFAAISLLIHPLMALPGLLLLVCLSVPLLWAILGALAGILGAISIACVAPHLNQAPFFLTLIRGEWLEMVQERAQYLFPQLWRFKDWEAQVSPVLGLVIAFLATEDLRVRRLCQAAIIVGAAGLLVAHIASSIGPVAILLQGQAWRWFWVTGFISVLTLAPTMLRLWHDSGCGAVCATLLVAGWTFPLVDGTACTGAALAVWVARAHVQPPTQRVMRWLAYAIIAAILAWVISNIWSVYASPSLGESKEPVFIEQLRSVFDLRIPALAVAWLGIRCLRTGAHFWLSFAAALLLCPICWVICAGSITNSRANNLTAGTVAEFKSLSQWRAVIPLSSNVLIVPGMRSAATIWFSLQRPSYLTVNQSAGVVFSRETAAEVRRRSEVLLPIMEPDWKIQTQLARAEKARETNNKEEEQSTPFTAEQLSEICGDRQLGFVIAKEALGFEAIQNEERGRWKDWNLYDCSRVRPGPVG